MERRDEYEKSEFGHGPRGGRGPRGGGHRGHGPGHGPGGGNPRRRGGRRPRGDVRSAVLLLLAEEPMHGYQLMETIAERSEGRWRPSPGAIYPTLNQLEDEGLVTMTASGGGRRQAALTEDGRALVDRESGSWPDPFAGTSGGADGVDLRGEMMQLHEAVRVVGRTGTDAQRAEVGALIADARRRVYLVLAGEPAAETTTDTTEGEQR